MKTTRLIPSLLIAIFPQAMGQLVEVNVAELKPTFGDTAYGAPTSRGNDGIDGIGDSMNWTHANYPTSGVPYPGEVDVAPNPYWQVDLGGSFDLTRIQLVDRVGCCDPQRLNGSTITLFDDVGGAIGSPVLVDGLALSNPAETAVVDFDNGGAGWTGVAAIRIDGLTANQYFQFSEFRAFSLQPQNAALGAVVTASGPTWGGQGPENMTDGSYLTQSHPQADFGTLGFTYSIDLGQPFNLEALHIVNRSGCCPERLSNYRVSLHDDDGAGLPGALVWTADVRTDGSHSGQGGIDRLTDDMDADGVFTGRHIVIENLSDEAYNPQIAEVEALTLDELLERPVNFAQGALAGFFNSVGTPVGAWNGDPASKVTDGLKGTFSHPLDQVSADYYLEIDMGSLVTVGSVAVTGRSDACCLDRLENARLELLDEGMNVVFSQVMAGQVSATQTFEIAGSVGARFVRIHNTNGAGYGPQVAEVEIFAPAGSDELVAEIESVVPASGEVTLSFNSVLGVNYVIFSSATLEEGSWLEVADSVDSEGSVTTTTVIDSFGIGAARRYYRIERE
ncbi:discoidin domain-containing protein [Akkermansiaceae bacterium]|nr:discoidin domain-containing protein [Akkermansiaceae bacterium]